MTVSSRLVGLCSVVVDLVLHVPALPERGGDVLATASSTEVGGGLNALAAAVRAGLPSAYAGGHGTGPFGDLARAALASRGVAALLPMTDGVDTGYTVVLVDPSGERTFATTVGAEGTLTSAQLAGVVVEPGDAVYLSGYDLAYPHAEAVTEALERLPHGTLVVFDPGPLVAGLPAALLERVLARSTWLSLNAREAAAWTGRTEAETAVTALLDLAPGLTGVVVRVGAEGAVVGRPGCETVLVPGVPVHEVVDTNGAGDVHVGTFVAALARGDDPVEAVQAANAAAAHSVSRRGPGTMGQ
jgi:sugar/nucleoside kinase (ribokinase family)